MLFIRKKKKKKKKTKPPLKGKTLKNFKRIYFRFVKNPFSKTKKNLLNSQKNNGKLEKKKS